MKYDPFTHHMHHQKSQETLRFAPENAKFKAGSEEKVMGKQELTEIPSLKLA